MNRYSRRILICSILIFFVIVFMIISTYAYFKNIKNDNKNELNKNIKISYNGSSDLALVNAKNNESVTKSWTIKNISNNTVYLSISLKNLINNFSDNSLYYSLYSKDIIDIKSASIINDNPLIASNIKVNANEAVDFILTIEVLNNDQVNNTFSSSIDINVTSVGETDIKDTLLDKILKDNEVKSDSELSYDNSDGEGLYWTNNSNDGNRIYFFRGSKDLNNNVKIDDTCFRILRTTENGDIKLIYNGLFEKGLCNSNNKIVSVSKYNSNSNYNAYVGYMYGSPGSGTYENEHENINSSIIRNAVNSFYEEKLSKHSSIMEDAEYCSNRKVATFTYKSVKYSSSGYKNFNTGYESMYNYINNSPSYRCTQENDRLTSKMISYPIGLITMDEVFFAGINGNNNTDNYLYSNNSYWTMTPAYYDGSNAYNFVVDGSKLIQSAVNNEYGVRPVITIKKTAQVISGKGTIKDPYILD